MTLKWVQWIRSKFRAGKRAATTDKMITCQKVIELLSEYINSELSPEDRAALEKHLAGCQNCESFFNTLRQAVQWSKELRYEDIPEEISSRLKNFLRSKIQPEK